MKDKQMACFILGMAIFACFFGMMKMQATLQEARTEAESAELTTETTSRQRIVAKGNFAQLQEKTKAEIEYYQLWRPHFESFPAASAVTDEFLANMKAHTVEPFQQDFTATAYKDKYGVITRLQRVNLVLVDDYAKLFNWLGLVESNMPTSRVTSLSVRRATGDEEIHMELTIDIPVIETAESSESS